jgi:hypothetical protein
MRRLVLVARSAMSIGARPRVKTSALTTFDAIDGIFPPMVRVRLDFDAVEPMRLPAYAGSAWRGLLGHSLRRTVCVTRQPTCRGCLLTATCPYSVFFESPPPTAESAKRYTAVPHPFVLDPEVRPKRDLRAGEGIRLGINLVGPAVGLLPYLIQAMARAGERGLGSARARFALKRVLAEQGLGSGDWRGVYEPASSEYRRVAGEIPSLGSPPEGPLALDFLTPLRIKRHGRFVGAAEFSSEDLLRNLVARLSSLAELYGDHRHPREQGKPSRTANEVGLASSDLHWLDWTRYSSRQSTSMRMGGLVGKIRLAGPGLAAFWPALWLGQWTHVGKGTSFGLGKYRLRSAGPDTTEKDREPLD